MADFTNTVPPTITGNRVVGGTLTAQSGTWSPTPSSYTYQWERADDTAGLNKETITGATGSTYMLTGFDVSKNLRVGVYPVASEGIVFVSPTSGQTISGLVLVHGLSTSPITTAEISVDGDAYRTCSVRGNKWRVSLNTAAYSAGSHTITVRTNGTTANSISVNIAASQTVIPGVGLFKLGDTGYTNTTNKTLFSNFTVGQVASGLASGAALSAGLFSTRDCIWAHAVNMPSGDGDGMGLSAAEITANNWWLTSGGSPVLYPGGGSTLIDIGNPAYQARLLSHFLNTVFPRFPNADGVFIDNIIDHNIAINDQYATNALWRTATISFLSTFAAGLQDAGYYVGVNCTANVPSADEPALPASYNAAQLIWWFDQFDQYVNAIATEYWMTFNSSSGVRRVGTGADQAFDGWQSVVAACESRGIDHHGWCSVNSMSETATMIYGRVAMLLDTDPRGGSTLSVASPYVSYSSTDNVYHSSYIINVGLASAAKTQPQTNLWKRVFANKTVYLNANTGSGSLTQDSHSIQAGTALIV